MTWEYAKSCPAVARCGASVTESRGSGSSAVPDDRDLHADRTVRAAVGEPCHRLPLRPVDAQGPSRLHRRPLAQIAAAAVVGEPLGDVLVALRLVDVVGDGDERAPVAQIVGVALACLVGP